MYLETYLNPKMALVDCVFFMSGRTMACRKMHRQSRSRSHQWRPPPVPDAQVPIPAALIAAFIGKQGSGIKQLSAAPGIARLWVDNERSTICICGLADAVSTMKDKVATIVTMLASKRQMGLEGFHERLFTLVADISPYQKLCLDSPSANYLQCNVCSDHRPSFMMAIFKLAGAVLPAPVSDSSVDGITSAMARVDIDSSPQTFFSGQNYEPRLRWLLTNTFEAHRGRLVKFAVQLGKSFIRAGNGTPDGVPTLASVRCPII